MFIGSFTYSIDPKGRISIPAKLRKYLSPEAQNNFVLTRGTDLCIDFYPLDEWKKLVESKLHRLNSFNPKDAMFMRMFLQKASEDSLDSQGRVLLPKSLLDYAGIEKEVLILGVGSKIELWNPVKYEEYLNANQIKFNEIAKEVMNI